MFLGRCLSHPPLTAQALPSDRLRRPGRPQLVRLLARPTVTWATALRKPHETAAAVISVRSALRHVRQPHMHCLQACWGMKFSSHLRTTQCDGNKGLACRGLLQKQGSSDTGKSGGRPEVYWVSGTVQRRLLLLQRRLFTCESGPEDGVACCAATAPAASAVQVAAPDMGVSSIASSTAGGVLISAVAGVMTLAASMSSGVCSCTHRHFAASVRMQSWQV